MHKLAGQTIGIYIYIYIFIYMQHKLVNGMDACTVFRKLPFDLRG